MSGMDFPLHAMPIDDGHGDGYIIKSRSTGKYLAMRGFEFVLVNRLDEAQRFCACHAPETAVAASKEFGMGFRVLEASK